MALGPRAAGEKKSKTRYKRVLFSLTLGELLGEIDASLAPSHGGLSDESEDIRVHRVPRAQAMQWLAEGKLNNASTIIALQWLALRLNQAAT